MLTNFNSLHVILLLDTKLLEIDKILDEQVVQVDRLVLTPLRQLKSLFESPTFLIEKREDKLLDYDSWKNKVSNTQNKEKVAEVCFFSSLKACPHWQLDRDRIAIRPIHIARWIRSRSDRDRLNPIRNSGRYLHVRYACSRNI